MLFICLKEMFLKCLYMCVNNVIDISDKNCCYLYKITSIFFFFFFFFLNYISRSTKSFIFKMMRHFFFKTETLFSDDKKRKIQSSKSAPWIASQLHCAACVRLHAQDFTISRLMLHFLLWLVSFFLSFFSSFNVSFYSIVLSY